MKSIVKSIFVTNHINEEFIELHTSGLANRVFATQNYILRIPTDHEEAQNDARTESIAAPVAKNHGIITPKLIKYDDSCSLLDRSYSIWERIHGQSVDQINDKYEHKEIWTTLGFELGLLHTRVKECSDPNGWLDSPERDYTKSSLLAAIPDSTNSSKLVLKINDLYGSIRNNINKVFVHGDTHEGNIMCTNIYQYSGLIDWGDSGWAEPAIDFYMIPYQVIDAVLKGYKTVNGITVDKSFLNQLILDKIWKMLDDNIPVDMIYSVINDLERKINEEI